MITKKPKYVYNNIKKYMAEVIEENDDYVELKIKGFDNCVRFGFPGHLYEINKEMPEVICKYSMEYFNKHFFEINKNEYNANLTRNLSIGIGNNCLEAYIFKNLDSESWNPVIYKTKLQLTEKGLYDAKRDNYPSRWNIYFSEHELRQNYEEQFDEYISDIYKEIKVLESKISHLHTEKNFIQVYKEMQQDAENDLDGPEIGEII